MSSMTDSQKIDEIYTGLVESSTQTGVGRKKWIWEEIWDKVCSIFTDLGKVWGKVQKIATDVGNLIANMLDTVPKVYNDIKHAMGGVETGIKDAAALIGGIKTDSVAVAAGHNTLADIETALDEVLAVAKMEGKVTNPITKLRQSLSILSDDMVEGLFGAMNAHVPDWTSIPEQLRSGKQLMVASNQGGAIDPWLRGTILVFLTGVRSGISAVTNVFPIYVGTGVIGGAAAGVALEVEITTFPVSVGKMPTFVMPALDIAYEIFSLIPPSGLAREAVPSFPA